jgi:hypothetical protein
LTDTATDLLEEFHRLKEDRRNFEEVWDEIAENVMPHRTSFMQPEERGKRNDAEIYDGTPIGALNMYASGSQGYLLSSSFKWFGLRVPEERLMNVREVRMWLNIVEQILYGLIQRSNFYKQMYEMFRDGGSIGTATVYTYFDPGTNRAWFLNRHPKEIYLAEDDNQEVDTVFRHFTMTNKRLVERFSENGDSLDKEISNAYDLPGEKYEELEVLHVVKPRPHWNPKKMDKRAKRWASYYVDIEHETIIREGGYDVLPYGVWRVEKNSEETYGRGPGWTALADIKGLYSYARTDISQAQLIVNPPRDIPKERKGQIRYVPGGSNYYEDVNRTVNLMAVSPNMRVGLDREERKQKIIEKAFMVDFFMMMAQADKEMTATEIRRRQEEKAIMLGPHITGLNQDVLDRIIDRLFRDAWDAGLLPRPPQALLASGGHIEVDYMGPLAQAQRAHFQTEPYRQTLGDIMGMAQMAPQVLDNYNFDYISRQMAKGNGIPEEALVEEKIVEKVRAARAQQQAQAAAAEKMKTLGQAVPGLNQPVQSGSVLESLNAASGQGATA